MAQWPLPTTLRTQAVLVLKSETCDKDTSQPTLRISILLLTQPFKIEYFPAYYVISTTNRTSKEALYR